MTVATRTPRRRYRRGAGAVEYGLVIALVAAGALVAVSQTGGSIAGLLSGAAGKLNGINAAVQPSEEAPLYAFSSHTFTNCGASGRDGPTLGQCRGSYGTSWDEDDRFFQQATHRGYQLWTVPATGTYRITAAGARGGYGYSGSAYYGQGRIVRAEASLDRGEKLIVAVGQRGEDRNGTNSRGGGGGGGSFVARGETPAGATPLLVAGGGGGGNAYSNYGYSGRYAGDGHGYATNYGDVSRDWGGYRGNGASWSQVGYSEYTTSQPTYNAAPFTQGLRGGYNSSCYSTYGGFGGGGTPHCHNGAGGGGYHGGAGGRSTDRAGEGGGSFAAPGLASVSLNAGLNNSHGYVTIERIGE